MGDYTQQNIFISEVNCVHCNTENRPIAKYCKNCGSKLAQKIYDDTKLKNVLSKIYQNREATEEEKNVIRKIINNWACKIPHHPYTNLGDLIEIKKVYEIPFYHAELFTQYESRVLKSENVPYYGQSYPKGKIDLQSYNIWENYKLTIYKDFVKHYEKHPIDGTYEIHHCSYCLGVGKIPCKTCGATGKMNCIFCHGRGIVLCSECNGRRILKCSYCYGTGRVSCDNWRCWNGKIRDGDTYKICSSCGGSGYIVCKHCNGLGSVPCKSCVGLGTVMCSHCGGDGKITCSECKGKGNITCYVCDGKGNLLKYNYIHIESFVDKKETKNVKDLPQEIFIEKHLRIFGSSLETYLKTAKIIVDVRSENINQDITDLIPHSELKEEIKKIIQQVSSEEKKNCYLDKHSGCRKVYQRLVIKQIPVFVCEYNYSRSSYTLWIFGNDFSKMSIFSLNDPISEYEQQLKHTIETYITNNDFENARKNYVLLEEMSKDILTLTKLTKTIVLNEMEYKNLTVKSFSNFKEILNKTNEYFRLVANTVKKYEVVIELTRTIEETVYMKYFTLIEEKNIKNTKKNIKIIVKACEHYFKQLKDIFSSFNGKNIFDLVKNELKICEKIDTIIDKFFSMGKYHSVYSLAKISSNILSYYPKNTKELNKIIESAFKKLDKVSVISSLMGCCLSLYMQLRFSDLLEMSIPDILVVNIMFFGPFLFILMFCSITGISKFIYVLSGVRNKTDLVKISIFSTITTIAIFILLAYLHLYPSLPKKGIHFFLLNAIAFMVLCSILWAVARSVKDKIKEKISKGEL